MRKMLLAIPALILALAACGQAAPSVSQPAAPGPTAAPAATSAPAPTEAPAPTAAPTMAPAATSAPTAVPAPTAPPTAAASPPAPGGGGTSVRPPDALVGAAQQRLAQHLGVAVESLMLQSGNQKDWPDGALGCPQPDQVYPQVVISGFLLVFSNSGQTQTYEVHTGESERQMILCENGQPSDLASQASQPTATSGGDAQLSAANRPLVELAQQDLAKQLNVDMAAIKVTQVEDVEWRDSSLGCPRPGMNYLQVITPGYRIVLEAQGRSYEYHSDTGKRVVSCPVLQR